MSSILRIASSRANGAQARGPVTDAGKLASAADAGFNGLLADILDEFRPETPSETRLIEIMAVSDWRRSRLWCLEMAQYTHAIHARERANDPIADHENNEIPSMHTALCDNSIALERLNRYEVRYSRDYHRILVYFKALRAERRMKCQISKQTEPNIG